MLDRWTRLGCTFYNCPIQVERPVGMEDGDKWKERVKRLECALRHGVEKMAYFGHYEDEHDDKNDLPHDFTKKLASAPAHLVGAGAEASEQVGDDELEEYAKARDEGIDEMIGVFMELTYIYMVRGDRQSAVEIAKMVMDLDNVSLKSAERIRDKLRRSIDSHLPRVTEDGTKPMGIG